VSSNAEYLCSIIVELFAGSGDTLYIHIPDIPVRFSNDPLPCQLKGNTCTCMCCVGQIVVQVACAEKYILGRMWGKVYDQIRVC